MKIVILAGGAGTRLWPMSTKEKPKQFQKLVSDKSMLQETYERVAFAGAENIYLATNQAFLPWVEAQVPQIPRENIILEPSMQDTAPCIGLAATLISMKDPEAVMATVSADHLVQNPKELESKLLQAATLAASQKTLNIIEVPATEPLTNLGYVEIGPEMEPGVHAFKAFKEKPDTATAQEFLTDGKHLWNTGYYVWRVDVILDAFKTHLPQTHERLMKIREGAPIETHYPLCEKISIDYGIMEKVDPNQVRILPANLGWSDIGTWESLHKALSKPQENLIKGNVQALECEGCVLYNETEKPLAVFGLRDTVVIQTEIATLSCPLHKSTELKKLHEQTN